MGDNFRDETGHRRHKEKPSSYNLALWLRLDPELSVSLHPFPLYKLPQAQSSVLFLSFSPPLPAILIWYLVTWRSPALSQ